MSTEVIENAENNMVVGLGERIRKLRSERKMTLQELSSISQVSVAMLSHIERGRSTPSIKVLDRIRLAFDVPFSVFFDGNSAAPLEIEANVVSRSGERPVLNFSATGFMKELLSPVRGTQMEMMLLHVDPDGNSGEEPLSRVGEKCGMVLEGQFELTVGTNCYELKKGDAFQFDSSAPHSFRNSHKGDTKIMWIILSRDLA